MGNKRYSDAAAALEGLLFDGMQICAGGFGLCGIPELLIAAAQAAGQTLTLRMQPGYDHSYFFMASFVDDHVAFHATRLKA